MPEISIIIPVYKVKEAYLRKCVESVMSQTFRDIEILLVDDGSPDQCGAICDEYAAADGRIKVIHKQNGGLSAARNTGVKNASGKWIMFVDGDDWISSEMCRNMHKKAIAEDVQVVLCGMRKEYQNTSVSYQYYLKEKTYRGEECRWLQEQILHFNGNIATAYCKLILKDLLEKHEIYHDELLRQGAEGLEFNLRLFEVVESATFINRPYYHYIYNENSISSKHSEENHAYVIKCFEKIRMFIENSRNRDRLSQWFDNRLLYVIITTAISGYFSPQNPEPYAQKKQKYQEYLNRPIIRHAIQANNVAELSAQRKIILWIIKTKQFWALNLLGKLRNWQKKNR